MNGNRISFNNGAEFEYFFIPSDFRPWRLISLIEIYSQLKMLRVAATEVM